jgi:ABC-type transporter Mla MlaB component
VDSSALTVIAELARELSVRRQRLAVAAPPDAGVRRLLEIARIDRLVAVADSVDAACAALAAEPD